MGSIMQPHSDTGSIVSPDTLALTVDPRGRCALLLPQARDLPDIGLALIAVYMRLENDPEFVAELIEWLDTQEKN